MNPDLQQACDRCHRRKTKCDKRRPACVACEKSNSTCTYSTRTKEPLYRRDYVEKLEKRARQLEINNRALEERVASITGQLASPSITNEPSSVPEVSPTSGNGEIVSAVESSLNVGLRARNDAASEVSYLSTRAGGDHQFLGSASGLFLASLVKASTQQRSETGTNSGDNSALPKPNWSVDDKTLPPKQMAQSLINAYLAHDCLCYPILHPKTVLAIVDSIYTTDPNQKASTFDGFTFNMLLAIATAQVYKFNWQILPDAETHHQRAMAYMSEVLAIGGIQSLQAILLCCQFRIGSSTKDASGSLWHLVGIASRMCFELGLHRQSTYALQDVDIAMEGSSILSPFEVQEMRRKCFWCVFSMDRVVSITLGRPLAIHFEDVDVELPSVTLDEDLPSPDETAGSPDILRIAPSYRVAVFVHIVRYRALCGRILTSLHRGGRHMSTHSDTHLNRRNELVNELEEWRADTASLKLPDMDLTTPLAEARSSFRSKVWYELLYQNGILLLYRPSPTTGSTDSPVEDDSIKRIHAAAKQSVLLYAYFFKSRKINFSWITLHAVFLAGLSYVYAVSQHLREKRKERAGNVPASSKLMLPQDPSIIEIVNDTRACSNVLVAVSERCNVPKNCHEVFDRLSDAVLADAVELYTNPILAPRYPTPDTIYGNMQNFAPNNISGLVADPSDPSDLSNNPAPHTTNLDPFLTVDMTLRDCIPDLQYISEASWGDDAILQLSMDWLEGIESNSDFIMAGQGITSTYGT